MNAPSYTAIQQALSQSRSVSDAAEAHGTLAGALCAAKGYRLEDWLAEILPEGQAAPDADGTLRGVFELTCRALDDEMLSFEPLLPADDDPLDTRTTALGEWCHGFLYGLGSGSLPDLKGVSGEVDEILRDLGEITRVGIDTGANEETNESAYAELVEFVRMGVQILFEELRPMRANPEDPPQVLH